MMVLSGPCLTAGRKGRTYFPRVDSIITIGISIILVVMLARRWISLLISRIGLSSVETTSIVLSLIFFSSTTICLKIKEHLKKVLKKGAIT